MSVSQVEQVRRIIEASRTCRAKDAWVPEWGSSDLSRGFATYSALLDASTKVQLYTGRLIPGLLQTYAYGAAQRRALTPHVMPERIEALAHQRAERGAAAAKALDRRVWFVFDEAALYCDMDSTPAVLAEQLERIIETVSANPQWTVQILPDGSPLSALSGFDVFTLPGHKVTYAETATGTLFTDSPESIAHCLDSYDRLMAAALGPTESVARIIERVRELWCKN